MSETLQGVIIGGLIASITPLIVLWYEYKKWKKEKKIEFLRSRYVKLQNIYNKSIEHLHEGLKNKSFSIDLRTDIDLVMPTVVSEKCLELIKEKDDDKLQGKMYFVKLAMKKNLEDIDLEIKKEIS
jgi:hypothetical protein